MKKEASLASLVGVIVLLVGLHYVMQAWVRHHTTYHLNPALVQQIQSGHSPLSPGSQALSMSALMRTMNLLELKTNAKTPANSSADFNKAYEDFNRAFSATTPPPAGSPPAVTPQTDLTEWNTAVQEAPSNPDALYDRGVVEQKMGRTDPAVQDMKAALALYQQAGDQADAQDAQNNISRYPTQNTAAQTNSAQTNSAQTDSTQDSRDAWGANPLPNTNLPPSSPFQSDQWTSPWRAKK